MEIIIENDKFCETLSIDVVTKWRIKMSNKISITISVIICSSLVAIASIRSGEMFEFHLMVGIPLFLGTPILYLLQTWISHQTVPGVNSLSTVYYRLMLTMFSILSLVVFCLFSLWSFLAFDKDWKTERTQWKRGDDGYVQHVVANVAEWLYLLTPSLFVHTFTQEFKRLELYEMKFNFELI